MTYVEGFLAAVPTANKDAYRTHAEGAVPVFKGFGATRLVEGWGDDVPDGKLTDFRKAVQAKEDETVVFSWIEYPSKVERDATNEKMASDPAFQGMPEMPFDGMRMMWSGFKPFLDERGNGGTPGYIDGFVMVIPAGNEQAYQDMAATAAPIFVEHGALRVVETLDDDLWDGKVTDYKKAVHWKDGERIGFSWIEWPDKATRDKGMAAFMEDERIKDGPQDMPFDGPRMIYGGFEPLVDR